jgi:hypothetical protein
MKIRHGSVSPARNHRHTEWHALVGGYNRRFHETRAHSDPAEESVTGPNLGNRSLVLCCLLFFALTAVARFV